MSAEEVVRAWNKFWQKQSDATFPTKCVTNTQEDTRTDIVDQLMNTITLRKQRDEWT